MVVIGIAGLLVNVMAFLLLRGADRENLNVRGALLHMIGDALGSAGAVAAAVGLMLVSLAAGAPGLPKMAEFAKVDTAAATSLMVFLVVVTIIVLPIVLPLLLPDVVVTIWDVASGLVYLILIPLAISLFVRARWESAAILAQPLFTQASNISLLFLLVLMIVLNFSDVVGLLGSGGLLASLLLVIICAAVAYFLGTFGKAEGWVQAFGAGQTCERIGIFIDAGAAVDAQAADPSLVGPGAKRVGVDSQQAGGLGDGQRVRGRQHSSRQGLLGQGVTRPSCCVNFTTPHMGVPYQRGRAR